MDHSKHGFNQLEEIIRNLNLTDGTPTVISDFTPAFNALEERLKEQIFRHRDENALILYSRLQEMKKLDDRYAYLFGLCRILGITDIYDIGCGTELQAGYLTQIKGISYTGIDSRDKISPTVTATVSPDGRVIEQIIESKEFSIERYNCLFEELYPNFKFIKAKYPFKIAPGENNIAILVGWYPKSDEVTEKIGEALVRDFTRILIQMRTGDIERWKELLPGFSLYTVNEDTGTDPLSDEKLGYYFMLATKHSDDTDRLNKIGYRFGDIRFHIKNIELKAYSGNDL